MSPAVDLSIAFPYLWKTKDSHLLYVQLFKGTQATGPSLVLQPMTSPSISRLKADGKTVEFVPDEDQAYSGVRAWVDRDILFHTSLGDLRFKMRPDCAPNTVWTIMHLVSGGFYRDVIWHRVVAQSRRISVCYSGRGPDGDRERGSRILISAGGFRLAARSGGHIHRPVYRPEHERLPNLRLFESAGDGATRSQVCEFRPMYGGLGRREKDRRPRGRKG